VVLLGVKNYGACMIWTTYSWR